MGGFGCVICSTPNGRGIHVYADFLSREVSGYKLIVPGRGCKSFLLWEMVGIIARLPTLLKAEELIFVNTRVSPFLWCMVSWRKISVVVHDLMDTLEDRSPRLKSIDMMEIVKRMINGYLLKASIERAGCVICNSRHTRNELCRWLGTRYKDSCILRPPLSFRQVLESLESVEQEPSNVEQEEGEVKILAIAGMSTNKALEDYFKLHSMLKREIRQEVKMVIYGVDLRRVEREVREYATSEENSLVVKYRGDSSELLFEYLTCDFLVSLSSQEGFGMPVADAAAFGIDSIVRDICAFREQRDEGVGRGKIILVKDLKECAIEAEQVCSLLRLQRRRSREKEWNKRKILYAECVKEELEASTRVFASRHGRSCK